MWLDPKESLSKEESEAGLRTLLKEGLGSQSMNALITGGFLVGLALELGASNLVIGMLASLPFLTQLFQIPTIYLVEKYRNRKQLVVYSSLVGRALLLVIAALPFLSTKSIAIGLLIGCVSLHYSLGAVSNCGWASWLRDVIPSEIRGAFIGKRLAYAFALGAALSLVAAFFVDWWQSSFPLSKTHAYSFLFVLSFLLGMISVFFQVRIPEPRVQVSSTEHHFLRMLLNPFKDVNFKALILFLGSWNFAINLAAPFIAVYMLTRLQYSMKLVILMTVLSQVSNVLSLQTWGKFVDRFSNKSVLGVCGPLFIACFLAFTFTTFPEKHTLTLPLLIIIHILIGTSTAGVTLASGNIGMKLAPSDQATVYLASLSFVNSLAAGIAPVLGGIFADFFKNQNLSLELRWTSPETVVVFQTLNFEHWDFFFFFAFVLGLYSIHRLTAVNEVGEVEEQIVLREIARLGKRFVGNVSSVAGLRGLVSFPFALLTGSPRRNNPDPEDSA